MRIVTVVVKIEDEWVTKRVLTTNKQNKKFLEVLASYYDDTCTGWQVVDEEYVYTTYDIENGKIDITIIVQ